MSLKKICTLIISPYIVYFASSYWFSERIKVGGLLPENLPLLFLLVPASVTVWEMWKSRLNGNSGEKRADISQKALGLLWLIILLVGLSTVFANFHVHVYVPALQSRHPQITAKEVEGLEPFFQTLFRERAGDIFVTLLLSALTGFVVTISHSWQTFLTKAHGVRKALKKILGKVQKQAGNIRETEELTEKSVSRLKAITEEYLPQMQRFTAMAGKYLDLKASEDEELINCANNCFAYFGKRTVDSLLHYKNVKNAHAERKLSIQFVTHCLNPPGRKGPRSEEKTNCIFADFGFMSTVVANLYESWQDLYNKYRKRIVYFTTLTMPLERWFDPEEQGKYPPSAAALWFKNRTLWEDMIITFRQNSDKVKFNRCYLSLGDEVTGTISKPEGIEFCRDVKSWWVDGMVLVNKETRKLAQEKIGRYTVSAKQSDVTGSYGLLGGFDYKEMGTEFLRRFHPSDEDLLCFKLNKTVIQDMLKIPAIKGYFEKSNVKIDDIMSKYQDGKEKWPAIFFNEHMPLDLFAIGVEESENTVIWKCCLSGFIGGDFYRMTLGWDDEYVSASSGRWGALNAYIEYLYMGRERFNCLSCKR